MEHQPPTAKKNQRFPLIIGWSLLALLAATMVYLNHITPLWSDDYVYSFVFDGRYYYDTSLAQRIANWRDILDSQLAHYSCVNGRFVAHTLVQLFLLGGKGWLWSLANTACMLLVIWLMLTLVTPKKHHGLFPYLMSFCLFWLIIPCPGSLIFWVSGSCGYLWAALLILLYLHLWRSPGFTAITLLLFPLAFLAGNSNESLTAGLAGAMLLWALFHHREVSWWQWLALLIFCAGVAANVLAPGNAIRLEYAGGPVDALASVTRLAFTGKWIVDDIHLLAPFLALLAIALLCWACCRSLRCPFYLPLAAVLCLFAVAYSHKFTFRSTFGLTFFAMLTVWPVFINLMQSFPRWLRALAGLVLLGLTAVTLYDASLAIKGYTHWEQSIFNAGCQGNRQVVTPHSWHRAMPSITRVMPSVPYLGDRRYTEATHLSINPILLHTRAIASYFGTGEYGIMPPSIHARLNAVSADSYTSLSEGEYRRVSPDMLIVRMPDATTALYAHTCASPEQRQLFPTSEAELRAGGYVLGEIDFFVHRSENGACFMMIPLAPQPGREYRMFIFCGHERLVTRIPADCDAGHASALKN